MQNSETKKRGRVDLNFYKKYSIEELSTDLLNSLAEDYVSCIQNEYLRIIDCSLDGNNLIISIDPICDEERDKIEWERFKKLQEVASTQGKHALLWFRDDDVYQKDSSLERLLSFMTCHQLPVLLCAIPGLLRSECVEWLKKAPSLMIAQHGYKHENHVAQGENSNELTVRYGADKLLEQMIHGRTLLKKCFSDAFIDIFVPPFYEIDDEIYSLMEKNNFSIFSIWGNNEIRHNSTIEINGQIDFVDWNKGYTFGGVHYVLSQLNIQLELLISGNGGEVIGIILHHERMGDESYAFIEDLMKTINGVFEFGSVKDAINEMVRMNRRK